MLVHELHYSYLFRQLVSFQVKLWLTFNEPRTVVLSGYGSGGFAPGIHSPGRKVYAAAHNMILAHAKAYRAYNRSQNGTIILHLT